MDSTIEVALATKLSKLFPDDDDKFLVFFPSLAFTDEELELGVNADAPTAEQMRLWQSNRNQFARVLNEIPRDAPTYAATGRTLWHEYRSVLEQAIPATNALTADEQQALAEARDFLIATVDTDDGELPALSPVVERYYQYKEKYEELERIYQDERITAEASHDEADRDAWKRDREPELRSLRDQALDEWLLLGSRAEVERHQATVRQLEGRNPTVQLRGLLDDLEASHEEDLLANDPVGTYSTFYSPRDVFDADADWSSIHITKAEFTSLVEDAPEAFRGRVSDSAGDIESLTVEYAKVVVIRSWFQPDLFAWRSWRLPDAAVPVSDGERPRQGRIPSYITNLIVVRKIEIERFEDATKPPSTSRDGLNAEQVKLILPGVLKLDHRLTVSAGGQVRKAATTRAQVGARVRPDRRAATPTRRSRRGSATTRPRVRDRRASTRPTTRDHRSAARNPATRVVAAARRATAAVGRRPATTVATSTPASRRPVVSGAAIAASTAMTGLATALTTFTAKPQLLKNLTAKQAMFTAATVASPKLSEAARPRRKRPVASERRLVSETLEFNGVVVLGCVCRRLPPSPDPDEQLDW